MGQKEGMVQLRFLFANHDGVSQVIEFPLDTTADSVKRRIMTEWPSELEAVDDPKRFRVFCMGKELETSSTKTLVSLNIPVYGHPTPVNVSVLPKSFPTPKEEKTIAKNGMPASADTCCIVM